MRAEVANDVLRDAVVRIDGMWARTDTMPILTGVSLRFDGGGLALAVANEAVWVNTVVVANGEDGNAVVDARQFVALAKRLPDGTTKLQVTNGVLMVESGRIKTKLPIMVGDFPSAPEEGDTVAEMGSDVLTDIATKVGVAVQRSDGYNVFSGVLLQVVDGVLYAVGTDSSRLAALTLPDVAVEGEWVVPAQSLLHAAKVADSDVRISASGTHIRFATNHTSIHSKLFSGQYPAWQRVIPDNDVAVTVDRRVLIGAIERSALFTDKQAPVVSLDIAGSALTVQGSSVHGGGRFAEEIACEGDGDRNINLNAKYLLDALKVMSEDEVALLFGTEDGLHPVLLKEDNWQYVLMPLRMG